MPTQLDELFDDNLYTDAADQTDQSVRRWGARHERGLDRLLDAIDEQADGVVGQANVAPVRAAVQLADNVLEQATDTYDALAEGVTNTYDDVTETASSLADMGVRLAESAKDVFLGSPGAAVDPVGAVADFTADAVTMGLNDIGEAADKALDSMSQWADEMGDTGFEPLDTLLEPLGDAVAAQLEMAGDAIDATITAIEDMVEAANEAVQDAVDWTEEAVNDAWDWVSNGGRTDEERAEDEAAAEEALDWAEDQADAAQEWADYLADREAEEAAADDDDDTTTTDDGGRTLPVEEPGGDLSNQMQRAVNRAADMHERLHIVDPIDEHGVGAVSTEQAATIDSGDSGAEVPTPLADQATSIDDDDLDDITTARRSGPGRAQMAEPSDADPEPSSHGPGGAQIVEVPDAADTGLAQTLVPAALPVEEVAFAVSDEVVEIDLDNDDDALDVFNDRTHHHAADDVGPMTANHLDLGDSE